MLLFRYNEYHKNTCALELGLPLTIRCSLYPSLAQHESQCQCCEIFHSWPIKKCSNTGVNPATRLTTQSTDARQVQQEWVRAVSGEGGNVALLRTVVLLCHKINATVASLHDAGDCFVCPLCALFFLPEFPFIYSFFHLCVIAPCCCCSNLPALQWSERGEYRIAPCCCCSKFASAVGLQRSEESTVSAPQEDQLYHGAVEAKCTCSPPTSRLCDSSKDIAWLHPTTATCVVFARWFEEQAVFFSLSSLVQYKTSHLDKYAPLSSGYNRSGRFIRYIRAAVSLAPHHWPPGS